MERAYRWLDTRLAGRDWAAGDAFSLADCAAAPALWYACHIVPFDDHATLAAYHARLEARAPVARTRAEAAAFWPMFPFSGGHNDSGILSHTGKPTKLGAAANPSRAPAAPRSG